MKTRYILGVAFLAIQVCSIIYARFIPERFFCWAPYDIHAKYEISVSIDNKTLTEQEVKERYHYNAVGWEQRAIENIFSYIEGYETSYGKDDNAKVTIKYAKNGKPQQTWTHP